MCKVGVRCAGHVGERLATKKSNLDAKHDELAKLEYQISRAKTNKQKGGLVRKAKVLKASTRKLQTEVEHIQREYDGTPTGQTLLKEEYLMADSLSKPIIYNRIAKGAAARDWFKHNAEIKKSGLTDRRNLIFGLNDGRFSDQDSAHAA